MKSFAVFFILSNGLGFSVWFHSPNRFGVEFRHWFGILPLHVVHWAFGKALRLLGLHAVWRNVPLLSMVDFVGRFGGE